MATVHKYTFLIDDGNGAASRGGEVDSIYEREIEAETSREAVMQVFEDLNELSYEDYLDEYEYEDEDRERLNTLTGEELLHEFEDGKDLGFGSPFLIGYMVDGKINEDFTYLLHNLLENEEDPAELIDVMKDNDVDLEKWGIDASKYEDDEDGDDWEDYGYVPTAEAIKSLLNGNSDYADEAADIIEGWYVNEMNTFGDPEFEDEDDFYENEDIGDLIDACDNVRERAITTIAYYEEYENTTLKEFLEDED